MKTIREICDSNFGGNWKLIETLEAREKERDAAERERVRAAVNGISFTEGYRKSILDVIYPPLRKAIDTNAAQGYCMLLHRQN